MTLTVDVFDALAFAKLTPSELRRCERKSIDPWTYAKAKAGRLFDAIRKQEEEEEERDLLKLLGMVGWPTGWPKSTRAGTGGSVFEQLYLARLTDVEVRRCVRKRIDLRAYARAKAELELESIT